MSKAQLDSIQINPMLNYYERTQLKELISSNSDCFSFDANIIGRYTGTYPNGQKIHIETGNASPIYVRPYKHSLTEREIIDNELQKLLKAGIIRRSTSPWGAPIVLVTRKDAPDRPRLCVSYVKLNEIIVTDNFPLPPISDIFAILKGARYFSRLDFANGFFQFELDKCCIPKTAMVTPTDKFEYLRVPMGLKNSPAVFVRMMRHIYNDLLYKNIFCYVDDVCIYSRTFDEHLFHIKQFLERTRSVSLSLRPSKCVFAMYEIKLLGYVCSHEGIKPDPDKIIAIKNMPRPHTPKLVKSFLGLVGFYRRFIQNFSHIAKPLNELTKEKVPFIWTEECDNSFKMLKEKLMHAPILVSFDPSKTPEIHTDASLYAIGYNLIQRDENGRPQAVCYGSRTLNPAESNYSATERELLAIVEALKKLREYTYGRRTIIVTDHHAICHLMKAKLPRNARLSRWCTILHDSDLEIRYQQGKVHHCADALSRIVSISPERMREGTTTREDLLENPELSSLNMVESQGAEYVFVMGDVSQLQEKISSHSNHDEDDDEHIENHDDDEKQVEHDDDDIMLDNNNGKKSRQPQELDTTKIHLRQELINGYLQDPIYSRIYKRMKQSSFHSDELRSLTMENDLLYYTTHANKRKCLVVPQSHRLDILKMYHDRPLSGHRGVMPTYKKISLLYYWPELHHDVKMYVNSCLKCAERKPFNTKPQGFTKPHELLSEPFLKYYLDILGPLSTSTPNRYNYVVVAVDSATRYVIARPLRKADAKSLAHFIVEDIVKPKGAPLEIVMDNASINKSVLTQETCKIMGISPIYTSPYSHTGNSIVERYMQTIEECISPYVDNSTTNWEKYLSSVVTVLNTTVHSGMKYSPYFLVHSKHYRLPYDTKYPTDSKTLWDPKWREIIAIVRKHANLNLLRNQDHSSISRNKKRTNPIFTPGTTVMLAYPNLAEAQATRKFSPKFSGPFEILKKLSNNSYLLINKHDSRAKPI